jgi:uncharacterized protein YbaA (DUF1428 family)
MTVQDEYQADKSTPQALESLQGAITDRLCEELTYSQFCNAEKDNIVGKNILLSGVWGSGKTSILRKLTEQERLKEKKHIVVLKGCRFYVIKLSLWEALATEATPITAFFKLLHNVLYTEFEGSRLPLKNNPHVTRAIKALEKSIDVFSNSLIKYGSKNVFDATSASSIAVGVLLKVMRQYSILGQSYKDDLLTQTEIARKFFHELIILLKEAADAVQILLIIDDLDRCKPDQALELLDTLYQLFLPREDLLQADEEEWPLSSIWALNTPVLEEFLHSQYRDLPSFKPSDYLEKMFQVRVSIPPLAQPEHALALVDNINKQEARDNLLNILGSNKLDYVCLGNLRLHKHILQDYLSYSTQYLNKEQTDNKSSHRDGLYIARCLVLVRAFSGFREQIVLQRAMWPEFVNRLNHPQRMTTNFRHNPIFRYIDNPDLLTLLLDLEVLGYDNEKACYFSLSDGQKKLERQLITLMRLGY